MHRLIIKTMAMCLLVLFLMTSVAIADALPQKIVITYVKFPLNAPTIVAKKLGLYEQEFSSLGISIEWPELTAGPKQIQAMAGGSVQFASAISADSVITANSNGMDIKLLYIYSRAPKAFNIMSKNSNVQNVADLKGKTIVGPMGSLMHQMLIVALSKEKMTQKDVSFVNMPTAEALTALLGGAADAALVAGPGMIKAQAGGAKVIQNGDGLVKGIIVSAVSGKFLREHPELVHRYIQTHKKALQFIDENPKEAIRIIAEETQLSENDISTMLPWYEFTPDISKTDIEDLSATAEFLKSNGIVIKPFSLESILM
jgi:sulfonate transport system substrate-binding protein